MVSILELKTYLFKKKPSINGDGRGDLSALAGAAMGERLVVSMASGLTIDDLENKRRFRAPICEFAIAIKDCMRTILQEGNKGLRLKHLVKEEDVWPKSEVLDELDVLLEGNIKDSLDPTDRSDNELNPTLQKYGKKWARNKAIRELLMYLERENLIKNWKTFRKFLDNDRIWAIRNSGGHSEGNQGNMALGHLRKIYDFYEELKTYPSILVEMPRFISIIGWMYKITKWFEEAIVPENLTDCWYFLKLDRASSEDHHDHSLEALMSALDSMEWNKYIDHQNRLEGMRLSISASKVIKIFGLGGLGKTALVYASLRELIADKVWGEHRFHRFTIKSKDQGEFTEEGTIENEIDYSILQWGRSVEHIITTLARHSKNYSPGHTGEKLVDFAIEYMKSQPCFVIIDNTEDVENQESREKDPDSFRLMSKFIKGVVSLPSDNRSRLIITSRISKQYDGVKNVEARYLNTKEIEELATTRSDFLWLNAKKYDGKIIHHLHGMKENDWNVIKNWVERKLGRAQTNAIGHPHFIILAVYEYATKREWIDFKDLLEELVRDPKIKNLEEYVSSKSIDFIDEKYLATASVLAKNSPNFTLHDVERLTDDDAIGFEKSLAEHLEELGLIKKWNEGSKENGYEWIDYARKELTKRYNKNNKAEMSPPTGHAVDKLRENLKSFDKRTRNDKQVVKLEEIVQGLEKVSIQGERIVGQLMGSDRELKKIKKTLSSDEDSTKRKIDEISDKVESLTIEHMGKLLIKWNEDDERSAESLAEAFVQHILNSGWDQKIGQLDKNIETIVNNFTLFDKRHVRSLLQDIVIIRLGLISGEEKLTDFIELIHRIKTNLFLATKKRIIAAIAEEKITDINEYIREFVSEYIKGDDRNRTILLEYTQGLTMDDLLDLLSKDGIRDNDDLINIYEASRDLVFRENFCRSLLLKTPPLRTNTVHLIIDPRKGTSARYLIHNAPITLRDKGTDEAKVMKLQHLFTVTDLLKETIFHLRFLEIKRDLDTGTLVPTHTKESNSEIPLNDLQKAFKEIIERNLSHIPQRLDSFGNTVNRECIEKLKLSSKDIRHKLWPGEKRLKPCIQRLYSKGKNEVEFDGEDHFITISRSRR
jgi:hypothetical protein